jgi:LuxR family maltose regulon positive regulatory protein
MGSEERTRGRRSARSQCPTAATPVPSGGHVPVEMKLRTPSQRDEWVDRPQLIRRLAGAATKLVLVDAPAGTGKTTLVAQWRSSPAEHRPFAWITLDGCDNDPVRLWSHVVSALQRARPEFGSARLASLLNANAQNAIGSFLPSLVNELTSISAPVVLVLDDYQVIEERVCHDQLEFLIHHLPPLVQIVLVTRADPPLPLGRLRATGDVTEIRMRELRFTSAEVSAFVHKVSGVQLSQESLASLVEQTEGWAAGIYLAGFSLRGHSSPDRFIRQFTGSNRYVTDFLIEEIISSQPPTTQQFLARTSILTRFNASLCDAVTGSLNSAEIIDALERQNLLVVSFDDNRQWYRYHHLFRQALLGQLTRAAPRMIPVLHERASRWHRLHGSPAEAVEHALSADDVTGAIELIAHRWFRCVNAGNFAAISGWLRSIGDEAIAGNPVAAHCAAWVAALSGELARVRRWLTVLDSAEYKGPLPDGMQSLASSAALLRGTFGFDGLRSMHESAAMATQLETDPQSPWYALARAALGSALYLSGEVARATVLLEEALRSEASIPMIYAATCALVCLAAVEDGQIERAQDLAHSALHIVRDPGLHLDETPQSSIAYTAAGAVYAAQGRPEEARREFERALRPGSRSVGISPWPRLVLLLRFAPVMLDLGDRPAAIELVKEARAMLTSLPDSPAVMLARLEQLDRQIAGKQDKQGITEPLTDREKAVLDLLREPLSQRQIGQELFLSTNTIKSHIRSIYRKLGVSTRHEAVQRGRELEIRLSLALYLARAHSQTSPFLGVQWRLLLS